MSFEAITEKSHPNLATVEPLRDLTIAVVGYGNQGRAHALNLRDSGLTVVIGQRQPSANFDTAEEDGFKPLAIADATKQADLVIVALPDEVHQSVVAEQISPALRKGSVVGFLHGYSVHHKLVTLDPSQGIILVAPKGPGTTLRRNYQIDRGIPALLAVQNESATLDAEAIAFAWATAIGSGRCGIIRTTFAEETETDLFGEQAVICGGMMHLMATAFQTLVDAGYTPEVAYLECCHEVKQVADLVYAKGLSGMAGAISNTAEFGMMKANETLPSTEIADSMQTMLASIQSGEFAAIFQRDYEAKFARLAKFREELQSHPIEDAGNSIRRLMPWLADH